MLILEMDKKYEKFVIVDIKIGLHIFSFMLIFKTNIVNFRDIPHRL